MARMLTRCAIALVALTFAASTAAAKDEVIKNPKPDSAEAPVIQAIKAGLAGDFDAYLETVHSEHKQTRDQVSQRKRYEWKRFKKQVKWYVKAQNPITIVITRRDPHPGGKYYRLFVKDQHNKGRMPVPVRLKKDGSVWKIVTSSL